MENEKLDTMLKNIMVDSFNNVVSRVEFFHKILMEKDQLDVYRIVGEDDLVEPLS